MQSPHHPRLPASCKDHLIVLLVFGLAFLAVPFAQLDLLTRLPGDVGDARLNHYFLENIYQFLRGESASLVHLGFFWPFPFVLGFSDNLFGSAPIYLLARWLTGDPILSFQAWYLLGFPLNFMAALVALRKLGFSSTAALIGSLVFTFALPVSAHSLHAQLHYRFGVPLALACYLLFLRDLRPGLLVAAVAWTVWQFYCTIYIGFFLLLMLAATTLSWILWQRAWEPAHRAQSWSVLRGHWTAVSSGRRWRWITGLAVLLLLLGLLFYPYLQVSELYGAKRSLGAIASMLPRPQSYLLSDHSWLWASDSRLFADLPMRHEHQMFPGAIPVALALMGVLAWRREIHGSVLAWLGSGWAGLMIVTLSIGGLSLWYLVAGLPLFSAIRAMTRIDLVFLFPLAVFTAFAVDRLLAWQVTFGRLVYGVLLPVMLLEMSAITPGTSQAEEWRRRLDAAITRVPVETPKHKALLFAQPDGPAFAAEIDAMWASLLTGHRTLNGYSGFLPAGLNGEFGYRCIELPRRVLAYLRFNEAAADLARYRELMEQVQPLGFTDCKASWWNTPPVSQTATRVYSREELQELHLTLPADSLLPGFSERLVSGEGITVRLINPTPQTLAATSSVGRPLRLSWRWIDSKDSPLTDWTPRRDLDEDVPANGHLDLTLNPGPPPSPARALEVTWVQEWEFWGHDIGSAPLRITLESR